MGCKILQVVTWPWTRPFQGIFFIGRVGLAMLNQCTKFEVSRFTRYEVMNGSVKMQKMGWFGVIRGQSRSRAMPPFDRAHTTSYSTLIETTCMFIFYRFRDIAGYLSKVTDFDPPATAHTCYMYYVMQWKIPRWGSDMARHQKTTCPQSRIEVRPTALPSLLTI